MVDLITCKKAVELYDNCDEDVAGWSGWAGPLGSDEYVEVTLLAYPHDDDKPMVTLLTRRMTKEEYNKLELYYIY